MAPTAPQADVPRWITENCGDPVIAAQIKNSGRYKSRLRGTRLFRRVRYLGRRRTRGGDNIGETSLIAGPFIESPQLEHGADTVVFVNDGVIETIEIFSYGGCFPEHLVEHDLKRIDTGR